MTITGSSTTPAEVQRDLLDLVERYLADFLKAERERGAGIDPRAGTPVEAIAELIEAGGKRIRPAFCIAGYLAAGGDPAYPGIVPVAAALEMLHACALLHDDVMDAAPLRRGSPTAHAKHTAEHASLGWCGESRRYGESVAILAGDLALSYADQLMCTEYAAVGQAWAQLRSELIIGQFMDIRAAAEFSVDPALSRLIAVIKSGRYTIHRPLLVGATLAGRPDLGTAFEAYGDALGEAFQLRDDLMDAFGDRSETGKPHGLDFRQHKMTLLQGLAIQRDPALRDVVLGPDRDLAEIRAALTATGVPEHLERHIDDLVSRGCRSLAGVGLAPGWEDVLTAMAHLVAYRWK